MLIGYGEQEHGETLERGHVPFVVYVKMYEKVVVHEVKVDIFGVAHADIKNRLRHPRKSRIRRLFSRFSSIGLHILRSRRVRVPENFFSGIRYLFAVAYLASRWRCRSK